jgi:hypothetical protein
LITFEGKIHQRSKKEKKTIEGLLHLLLPLPHFKFSVWNKREGRRSGYITKHQPRQPGKPQLISSPLHLPN